MKCERESEGASSQVRRAEPELGYYKAEQDSSPFIHDNRGTVVLCEGRGGGQAFSGSH